MKHCKLDWKCRCGKINTILLCKYINKSHYWCQHCNQDRSFAETTYQHVKWKEKKPVSKPINSQLKFEDMGKEFFERYQRINLTTETFWKYLPYMYSINGVKLNDDIISHIKYEFIMRTNNQIRFCSKISFDDGKTWKAIGKIELICSICGKIFSIHKDNLNNQKIGNFICKQCKFSNITYKTKKYKDTNLNYQSNLELDFINFCFANNIKIENGVEIPYINHNNKKSKYITDFILPEYKMIVELKGSNHFYRKDKKIGRIDAKNNAATEFANKFEFTFQFVLDENINDFKETLLRKRDSLNNGETH